MIVTTVIAFILNILSQSLLPFAQWQMAIPDFAVLFLCVLVALPSRPDILRHALILGLLWDFMGGAWFGYHTGSLLLFAVFLSFAQSFLYMDRPLVFFSTVLVGCTIRQGSMAALLSFSGTSLKQAFWSQFLGSILYSLLFAFFLFTLQALLKKIWVSMTS